MKNNYIETYQKQLCLRNRSKRTIDCYKSIVGRFLNQFKKHPKQIVESEIIDFILQHENANTKIQVIGALKGFYKTVARQPLKLKNVPYPKREQALPNVLPMDFIWDRINAILNTKHKAILAVGASTGMRVSEVCNIKLQDIDSKSENPSIKIVHGKGAKDRYVPLTPKLKDILKRYYNDYHPKDYLFEGQFGGKYSTRSCEAIYHKYIDQRTAYHCLRHSRMTDLHNKGVGIRFIQDACGHKKITTCEVYTHVSKSELYRIFTENE